MKIKPVGMFATYKTQKELVAAVEGLGTPEAIIAMMFTWNHLCHVLEDVLREDCEDEAKPAEDVPSS